MKGVKVTLDRVAELMKSIRALSDSRVMVGIPADNANRQEDPDDEGPMNNAALGYIHEHGAPEVNIPARPFLVPGVKNASDAVANRLKGAATAALDGKPAAVEMGLNAAGLEAQNSVRAKINEGVPPPIATSTALGRIRRTKRMNDAYKKGSRGHKSEMIEMVAATAKPLIVTGQLRNAITYVIRRRGK